MTKEEMMAAWVIKEMKMVEMKYINVELEKFTPKQIIELTHHDKFGLNDDYFFFIEANKIGSVKREYVERAMKELSEENNGSTSNNETQQEEER